MNRNPSPIDGETRSARTISAAIGPITATVVFTLFISMNVGLAGPKISAVETITGGSSKKEAAVSLGSRIDLFSGLSEDVLRNWLRCGTMRPAQWKAKHGAMIASGGDICTRARFRDLYLHVEFKVPYKPNAHGQARGNSGIKLQGAFEIQILDSFGIADPGSGDCGAIYGQSAPLVNACRPPRKWQNYDIVFRAPRFDPTTHTVTELGRVTVIQNGIVVQDNQEIEGVTGTRKARYTDEPGPILLQYHGSNVEFRNVWVVPLPPHGAQHY